MTILPGLLVLALLGQPPPRTYYWRDSAGQTHVTNTPPPSDAEILQPPPPPAVEPGTGSRPEPAHPGRTQGGAPPLPLSPAQQQAWEALDQRLGRARAEGDRRTLEAAADALIDDGLWGQGLWTMALAPVLALALMGLLGWWFALGLRPGARAPLVVGSVLLGLGFGQLLLSAFLYQAQATRLQESLNQLEYHLGIGRALRPERQLLLQQRCQAMERAAGPLQAPWRFPAEVGALRSALKQVMVEP